MGTGVGRRLVLISFLALPAFAASAAAAPSQSASWAAPAIRVVSAAGLMGGAKNVAAFRASGYAERVAGERATTRVAPTEASSGYPGA